MTETSRVTRVQAAVLADVNPRTINRWSARGLLTVHRRGWNDPAEYDRDEVIAVATRPQRILHLPD